MLLRINTGWRWVIHGLASLLLLAGWMTRSGTVVVAQTPAATPSASTFVQVTGSLCSFNLTFVEPFEEKARTAFVFAASRWANAFSSSVPVRVVASFTAKGPPEILGSTFAYLVMGDTANMLLNHTWYNSALAGAITGDPTPGNTPYDMQIDLNSNVPWHYDPYTTIDLLSTPGAIDLATTVMHEMAQGIGFSGTITANPSSQTAQYGLAYDTHYGYPAFSVPGRFDSLLTNVVGCGILDACSPYGEHGLYEALTKLNSLYISGVNGSQFMLYSPDPYNPATNTYQFSPTTWKRDCVLANISVMACSSLVTPYTIPGEQNYLIGENTLSVLELLRSNVQLPSPAPGYCKAACSSGPVLAIDAIVSVGLTAQPSASPAPLACASVGTAFTTALAETLTAYGYVNTTVTPTSCLFDFSRSEYFLSTSILGTPNALASNLTMLLKDGSASADILLQSSMQISLGSLVSVNSVRVARIFARDGINASVLQPLLPFDDILDYNGYFLIDWQVASPVGTVVNESATCDNSGLTSLLESSVLSILESELNLTSTSSMVSGVQLFLLSDRNECLLVRNASISTGPIRYDFLFTVATKPVPGASNSQTKSDLDAVASNVAAILQSQQLTNILLSIAPPGYFAGTEYVRIRYHTYNQGQATLL